MGKKNNNNLKKKKSVFNLVFDEDERVKFLTGFRKRKNERRKKAQEAIKKKMKDDKKTLQNNFNEKITAKMNKYQLPPAEDEVEPVIDSNTYDLPDHCVTITEVVDYNEAPILGTNREEDDSDSDNNEEDKSRHQDLKSTKRAKTRELSQMANKLQDKNKIMKKKKRKSRKNIDMKHKTKKLRRYLTGRNNK